MLDVNKIANEADMIINGYAFKKLGNIGSITVVNLNNPQKAVCFSMNNNVLETTMDDIELHIVKDYLEKNADLMDA